MKGSPAKPVLIEVTPRLGVSLVESLPGQLRTSTYAVATKGWIGTRFFSGEGTCHQVARLVPERRVSMVEALLARTFHNRRLTAEVEYERGMTYEFDDLRQLLIEAVKDDDDILTQWRDANELLTMLEKARTFGHLVGTLRFAGVGK